jgi:hypothetical protein
VEIDVHTDDEYEISLYREMAVCKNTIQRIKSPSASWSVNTTRPLRLLLQSTGAGNWLNIPNLRTITRPGRVVTTLSRDGRS